MCMSQQGCASSGLHERPEVGYGQARSGRVGRSSRSCKQGFLRASWGVGAGGLCKQAGKTTGVRV
eukprot:scaffold164081_cov24-Tisochrysis_lutea.AAC.1